MGPAQCLQSPAVDRAAHEVRNEGSQKATMEFARTEDRPEADRVDTLRGRPLQDGGKWNAGQDIDHRPQQPLRP